MSGGGREGGSEVEELFRGSGSQLHTVTRALLLLSHVKKCSEAFHTLAAQHQMLISSLERWHKDREFSIVQASALEENLRFMHSLDREVKKCVPALKTMKFHLNELAEASRNTAFELRELNEGKGSMNETGVETVVEKLQRRSSYLYGLSKEIEYFISRGKDNEKPSKEAKAKGKILSEESSESWHEFYEDLLRSPLSRLKPKEKPNKRTREEPEEEEITFEVPHKKARMDSPMKGSQASSSTSISEDFYLHHSSPKKLNLTEGGKSQQEQGESQEGNNGGTADRECVEFNKL